MLRAVGVFSSQERIKYLSLLCAAPELQGETHKLSVSLASMEGEKSTFFHILTPLGPLEVHQ